MWKNHAISVNVATVVLNAKQNHVLSWNSGGCFLVGIFPIGIPDGKVIDMTAYKCDICGKYIDDCYVNDSDVFDFYTNDSSKYFLKQDKAIKLRDMCKECYSDIKAYIHDRYLKYHTI